MMRQAGVKTRSAVQLRLTNPKNSDKKFHEAKVRNKDVKDINQDKRLGENIKGLLRNWITDINSVSNA